MLTRRRGLGERGDKILRWRHSNCTHYDACRRETAECSQKRSEVWPGRLSSRFRLRAYRAVQTRPVSSRSVHHGIFPDFYFYTHSLQRPHERRPMASRREQVSALFFAAWTQRRLTECFPWATEGPNPPKETPTFKKDFFGKQLRDHYSRALSNKMHVCMKPQRPPMTNAHALLDGTETAFWQAHASVDFHVGEQIKTRGILGEKGKGRPTTGSPRCTHTDNEGRRRPRMFNRLR